MCAVGTDRRVSCWSYDSRVLYTPQHLVAPDGAFVAVAAGGSHSCGLRTDGTVACWGRDSPELLQALSEALGGLLEAPSGLLEAPSGAFSAIAASRNQTCGLRTDGQAECWGIGGHRSFAVAGPLTSIVGGIDYVCGLRPDGAVVCWGDRDTPVPHFVRWADHRDAG